MQEPVTVRGAAGGQAKNFDRDHLVTPEGDQCMRRSDEPHGSGPIGQLVTHHFGNWQCGDRGFDCRLQRSRQARAGCRAARHQDVLLAIGLAGERRDIHIGPSFGRQLLEQRGRGRAAGVKTDLHGHELFGVGLGSRLAAHCGQSHGKPARGGEGLGDALWCHQSGLRQRIVHAKRERLTQARQRLWREFFGEQLDQ